MNDPLENLQAHVTNQLPLGDARSCASMCGIVGGNPSKGAKSPELWRAAYDALQLDAVYLPFDVAPSELADFVSGLRAVPNFRGMSVTVPHKESIVSCLDALDPLAERIGATNCVVREQDGRLVGYNTDAEGAVASLLRPGLEGQSPVFEDLSGLRFVLLGSGGAAKAVAHAMAQAMGAGHLCITNRHATVGRRLATRVAEENPGVEARFVEGDALGGALSEADLVVNATAVGQGGTLGTGRQVTSLEPYSALAPAQPVAVEAAPAMSETKVLAEVFRESLDDIVENRRRGMATIRQLPASAVVLDIVYRPLETVMLRHARWAGLRCIDGRAMNVLQAVEAFHTRVMNGVLQEKDQATAETYASVASAMAACW